MSKRTHLGLDTLEENASGSRGSNGITTFVHSRSHVPDRTASVLGAQLVRGGCMFRVWSPESRKVEVLINNARVALQQDEAGYFTGLLPNAGVGDLYKYILDDGDALPDPCTRFQPQGPHGPSMIVDLDAYRWRDNKWTGITLKGQVLYELHIGSFTTAGTFDAAAAKLGHLHSLGVTAVELMPIIEWAGRWNWGYDGVCLFAPSHRYGDYQALKRFVDRAHSIGLGVILDVVYNHLGPEGNYLPKFSPHYFSDRHTTEWGKPLNFDGEFSTPVREFVIENACEWIREFHIDGLRLDATQSIFDDSPLHILAELGQRTRRTAAPRQILLIAENEPQHANHLLPLERGGLGFDAMWNDDFHHSAYVAATGKRHAYFHDYAGQAQEFVSAAKHGFLYQGQYYPWQQQPRGRPLQTALMSCVAFLQNHDQVANSLTGERLHKLTSPGRYRALTTLLLLAPQTPMLFMGQEFQSSRPFLFFADHQAPLRHEVFAGRKKFLEQFPGITTEQGQQRLDEPANENTFIRTCLDWTELSTKESALSLHKDLLNLRRIDPVIAAQAEQGIDGAVLSEHGFVLRWFDAVHGDRLLVVNLGVDIPLRPMPEPLLASPPAKQWSLVWSSEDIRYDGIGIESPLTEQGWRLPAESAVLFAAVSLKQ